MTSKQTPKPAFDLADLDTTGACNKGFELELLHPITKEPTGMFISVYGMHSDRYLELVNDRANKSMQQAATNRRMGKDPELETAEDMDAKELTLLAGMTFGWREIKWNGEAFSFSVPNAIRLYKERMWIKYQVNSAIYDIKNFMKA